MSRFQTKFDLRGRWSNAIPKAMAVALATGAGFAAASPALAQAPPETGVWLDDTQQGAVEIYVCQDRADRLCGRIVWLRDPLNAEGKPKFDRYNPNAALQGRPICGLSVIGNLAKASDGGFDSGWIYDPKTGKSYSAAIALTGSNTLTVTGYLGMKFMGKSFTWTRAPESIQKCMLEGAPAATPMKAPAAPAAQKPNSAAAPPQAPAAEAPAAPKKQAAPQQQGLPTQAKPKTQAATGNAAQQPAQSGAGGTQKPPAQAAASKPQAKTAVSASPVLTDKPKPAAKKAQPSEEAEALPWQPR